jgi:hypothetical protein
MYLVTTKTKVDGRSDVVFINTTRVSAKVAGVNRVIQVGLHPLPKLSA